MKNNNLRFYSAFMALLLIFASTMALAQTSRGTITGSVTDPTGAVVPKATVTLTDKATNIVRTTETNASGLYRFDAVNLGEYDLSVSASGFGKAATSKLAVAAGRSVAATVVRRADRAALGGDLGSGEDVRAVLRAGKG